MGDGRVALILDVLGIARTSGMGVAERSRPSKPGSTRLQEAARSFLLISLGDGSRLALPLAAVARLEEIDADAVETTTNREVVQYRGRILPLVRLSERFAGVAPRATRSRSSSHPTAGATLASSSRRSSTSSAASPEVQDLGKGPGILGTAILQRRATALLDVPALIHEPAPIRRGA